MCAELAVEGSDLCTRHREAAARFSAAFAPAPEVPTAPAAAAPDDGATPDATAAEAEPLAADAEPKLGATDDPTTNPTADATRPADNTAPAADPLAETLATALTPAWRQLEARVTGGEIDLARRWPKLSCYFLDDLLHVRVYFTIIPPERAGATAVALTPAWSAALAPGGQLYQALLTHLRANEPELRRGSMQSLDLHLVTYAEIAVLNANRPDGQEVNRAVFIIEDGGWRSTTLDQIQPRLGHERWRTSNAAQSA